MVLRPNEGPKTAHFGRRKPAFRGPRRFSLLRFFLIEASDEAAQGRGGPIRTSGIRLS